MKQLAFFTVTVLLLVFCSKMGYAQVAIGTGATAPNPDTNAVLLLEGNGSQGIIIPKVTSLGPFGKPGMIVYNSTTGTVHYFSNTWVQVGSGGAGSQGIQISGNKVLIGTGAGFTSEFSIANTAPAVQGQILMWDTSLNAGAGGWTSSGATAPLAAGQVLKWNGSRWEPGTDEMGAVTTLSGNVTGPTNNTTISNTAGNNVVAAINNAATTSKILPAQISSGTAGQVLTTTGGVAVWAAPTGGALPSLSANQLLSNNGTNIGINVAGDVGLSVTGTTGTFTIAPNAITDSKVATGISAGKITTGTLPVAQVPNLDAAKITTGTFTTTQIPSLDAAKITTGTFTSTQIPNLDAAKITTGTISTARLDVGTTANKIVQVDGTGKLPAIDGSQLINLPTGSVTDGSITGGTAGAGVKIAANTITDANINSLNAAKITSGTLPIARIAAGDIDNTKLATGIDAAKITTGTLSGSVLPANVLLNSSAAGGELSGTLAALSINNNAITTTKINNGAVTIAKISTAGVPDANKILSTDASGVPQWTVAAGGGDMLKSTYDPTNINGSAFTLSNHTGQISTAQITDANVTNIKLATGIDAAKITTGTLPGTVLPANVLLNSSTAGGELSGTLSTLTINSNAITTAKILDANVTTAKLADNSVTTTKINNGAVTIAKISTAGVPDANKILSTDASGVPQWTVAAGGGDMLKSTYDPTNINGSAFNLSNHTGQISTTQITDANVTNIKLAAGIDAAKITTGTLPTAQVPGLDASKIISGTFTATQIPALDANKITTGTFTSALIPNLDANKITTGTLPVAVGGTGANTLSGLVIGNGASPFTAVATGANGQILTVSGGNPTWQNVPAPSGSAGGDLLGSTYPNPVIAAGAINSTKLANDAVTTININNLAVTNAKINDVDPSKITAGGATNGQVLKFNGTNWVAQADAVGGGGAPTLNVGQVIVGDGTTNSAATVGLDATLALNGNITVQGLRGRPIDPAVPATNSVYQYNGTQWTPVVLAGGGTVTSITAGTGLTGGTISGSGTIGLAAGGVGTTELANNAVTAAKLSSDGSIDANRAVTTNHVRDAAITDAKLASGITVSKLTPGTNGQVLTTTGGVTTWQTSAALTNPMTTLGDIISGGVAGAPGRLGVGANGQILTVSGGVPTWQNAAGASTLDALTDVTAAGATDAQILIKNGAGDFTNRSLSGDISITNLGAATIANNAVTNAKIATGIDAAKITTGTLPTAQVPNLDASKITTGTLPNARLNVGTTANQLVQLDGTSRLPAVDGSQLINLPAGTVADGSITGGTAGAGVKIAANTITDANILSLDAAKITSGTLPIARIAAGAVDNTKLATGIDAAKITTGTLPVAQVPNLDVAKITTGTLPIARGGTGLSTIPTNGQLLIGNGTGFAAATLTNGTGINVTNGAGTITVAANAGTGANQLVQLDGTSRLPAVDGSQLINLPAGTVADGSITGGTAGAGVKIAANTITDANILSLDAAKITSGTLPIARIAAGAVDNTKLATGIDAAKITTGTLPVAQVPNLDATKITTGTFVTAQIPNLDASKITTGTLPVARGGSGITAVTPGGVAYGGATDFAFSAAGTTGQLLQSNGTAAPTWVNAPGASWGLTGNPGTNPATDFIGTVDAQPLRFATGVGGIERMRIMPGGNVGIGTNLPGGKLDVAMGVDERFRIVPGSIYFGINGVGILSANDANSAYRNLTIAAGDFIINAAGGTGNVGIKNNSPTEILDVTGNVKFSGALMPNNLPGTAGQVLTSAGAGAPPTWTTVGGGGNMISTNNLSDVANVATSRTNLGLGALATLGSVTTTEITDGTITNIDIASVDASKITTGTLAVARGGTNSIATPTNGGVSYGTGTAYAFTAAGTSGQLLQSNGAAAPTWVAAPATVTASNGLTKTVNNIALGGPLTAATTITNAGFNLAVTGTGNVGIGAAVPVQKLDVNGNINMAVGSGLNLGNVQFLRGSTTANNIFLGGLSGTLTTGTSNVFVGTNSGAANTTGFSNVFLGNNAGDTNVGGSGNIIIGAGAGLGSPNLTNAIAIGEGAVATTSGTIVLGTTNRVGIGTSSPLGLLSVNSPGATDPPGLYLSGFGATEGDIAVPTGEILQVGEYNGTAFTERMRINTVGNMGVGTITPSERLDVAGNLRFSGALMPNNAAGTAGQVLTSAGVGLPPTWTTVGGGGNMISTNNLSDVANVATSRTNLGLGALATLGAVSGGTGGTITDATITAADLAVGAVDLATTDVTGTLSIANGGTNRTTAGAAGTILYSNGTALLNSAAGTTGQVLTSNGAGAPTWTTGMTNPLTTNGDIIYGVGSTPTRLAAGTGFLRGGATPSYSAINLASADVTGILPVANGGTGANTTTGALTSLGALGTTLTNGNIFVGNGSNVATGVAMSGDATIINTGAITISNLAVTTSKIAADAVTGAKLQSDVAIDANRAVNTNHIRDLAVTNAKIAGVNASKISGTLPTANGGTGITSVVPGAIAYGGATDFAFSAVGTSGQLLQSNGAAAPTWVNAPAAGWGLTGNAGTNPATDFIGTTDNVPLNFRVNGQKAGRIDHLIGSTFLGYQAGNSNTGSENTATGLVALSNNTTGSQNTANGSYSLQLNTGGYNNTASGSVSLYNNTIGIMNTANGMYALSNNTSGNNNTAIGSGTLTTNITGDYNTAIGNGADVTIGSLTKATAIGFNAKVATSNSLVLGGTSVDAVNVGINTTTPTQRLDVVGNVKFSGALMPNDLPGTAGQVLTSAGAGLPPTWAAAGGGWGLTGNAGTNPATNFIGTTDAQPLRFGTGVGGTERMRIDATGNVGIGTTAPTENLTVANGMNIDQLSANAGTIANSLKFGVGTGEAIGSRRVAGANQFGLDFYTGAINRMSITNGGNVGIGTTAPTGKLSITTSGSAAQVIRADNYSSTSSNDGTFIVAGRGRGTETAPQNPLSGDRLGAFMGAGWITGTTLVNSAGIELSAEENFSSSAAGSSLRLYTTSLGSTIRQERMRIEAAGNVGIGTGGTASERLHVTGNIRFSGALMPNNLPGTAGQVLTSAGAGLPPTWAAAGGGWGLTGNAGTNPVASYIGTSDNQPLSIRSNGTESIWIMPDGSIGIGTSSPTHRLHVNNPLASNNLVRITNTAAPNGMVIGNAGGGGLDAVISNDEAASLFFRTNAINRMTIDAGGKAGIGTTTLNSRLNVFSNTTTNTTNTYGVFSDVTGGGAGGSVTAAVLAQANGNGGTTTYGLYAAATGSASSLNNWSGYFAQGNVHISGGLSVGVTAGTFGTSGQVLTSSGPGSPPTWTSATGTASNGLTRTGIDIALGGTLTSSTTIATAGNNLSLTGAGNFGVGTTTPARALEISGDGSLRRGIRISQTTAGTSWDLNNFETGASEGAGSFGINLSGSGNKFIITPSGNTGIVGGAGIGSNFHLTTPPLNGAIIEGNVGIGVVAPTNKFEVAGTTTTTASVSATLGGANEARFDLESGTTNYRLFSRASDNNFGIFDALGGVTKFRINSTSNIMTLMESAGDVGIGTNSPTKTLEMFKTSLPILRLRSSINQNSSIELVESSSDFGVSALGFRMFYDGLTDNFKIQSSAGNPTITDHLVIDRGANRIGIGRNPTTVPLEVEGNVYVNGNIGILTTTPTHDLTVKQSSNANTSANGVAVVSATTSNYWKYHTSGTLLRFSYWDGSLLSSPISYSDGNADWTISSDRRLKEGFEPVEPVLESVMKLNPMRYFYKRSQNPNGKLYGFIAQDMETVFPSLVSPPNKENEYYGLNYENLHSIAIKAIQELNVKIEALEKENSELKNSNTQLKAEVSIVKEKQDTEIAALKKQMEEVMRIVGAEAKKKN